MINTSESRIIFNGNGTATEFPYSFAIINDTDVKVMTVDPDGVETVLDSDYYVDVTASKVIYPGYTPGEEPAESERPPVLPTGWQLVVYRDIPITQEANLGNVWPFNVIEDALDKITMILQNIYDGFKRSFKVSQSAPADIDIYVPIEANKALKWNADGTQIVTTVDPADVLPQAQTLLQQTTEQANIATNKANVAAESALAAATSEANAGAHEDKAQAWAESETSPDGEPTSKSAKTWAGDSADSAELAQKWAESEESPDGEDDADSPTGDTMSAKEWALYAKEIAENMGNPVTSIAESNGQLEITASDASKTYIDVLTPDNATLSASGVPAANADNNDVANTAWVRRTIETMAETLAPDPVKARKIEKSGNTVKLWWSDPDDGTADGVTVSRWGKTIIVKKQGSYPEKPTDGTVVVTVTTRNQYADEPYTDTQVSPENWYYRAFPMSPGGMYSTSELNRFGFWHYGIYIDETDPDEETCVHKLGGYDNYFFERPFMDFDEDKFYWGGWKNVQMLPKPCMLNSDGTVDYYLDPDDYTKKADGTASDVTNMSYDGNAMMEWAPVFTKVVREGNRLYMYFCSEKYDDDYECYSCKKSDGEYGEHFYMPIYEGYVSSGKMRSMSSGQKPTVNTTAENEATYATANGTGWNTTLWADEQLLQMLGILFFERLNLQVACGYNPGSSTSAITHVNGTANAKGMFYGHASTNAVGTKYFGMENWWGHRWRRCNGLMTIDRRVKVKLTNSTIDGSTVTGYNRTGNGYIDTGVDVPSASESYIKEISGDPRCVTAPVTVSGASSTTYYCDAAWSAAGTMQLLLGGSVSHGALAGLFAFNVNSAPSHAYWASGASLSYKSF